MLLCLIIERLGCVFALKGVNSCQKVIYSARNFAKIMRK